MTAGLLPTLFLESAAAAACSLEKSLMPPQAAAQ
jgi:hypothetical protein